MELDCIPAGMELFPAIDDEQFEFIKRVIDDCDYYLIMIGGRYGSISSDGLSYTEKEYDYAIHKGKKVLAFIHADPSSIVASKTELIPELRKKLENFKSKVATGRLVKHWKNADELSALIATNLPKTIRTYPAAGWVRGDTVANTELVNEIISLKQENAKLLKQIEEFVPRDYEASNEAKKLLLNMAENAAIFSFVRSNGWLFMSGMSRASIPKTPKDRAYIVSLIDELSEEGYIEQTTSKISSSAKYIVTFKGYQKVEELQNSDFEYKSFMNKIKSIYTF